MQNCKTWFIIIMNILYEQEFYYFKHKNTIIFQGVNFFSFKKLQCQTCKQDHISHSDLQAVLLGTPDSDMLCALAREKSFLFWHLIVPVGFFFWFP